MYTYPIRSRLALIAILLIVIILLNLYLLSSFFGYGLIIEDWKLTIPFRFSEGSLFSKFINAWYYYGPSMAHQVIYLGMLDQLFPSNYDLFQKLNFSWKIVATLSLLPTVWILTKSRLLAILCTIFFTISFASAGSLAFIIDGVDYLAITYVNLFFICYYLFFKNNRLRFLFLSFTFLQSAILTSLHRIYPLFFIILVIETVWLWKRKSSILPTLGRLTLFLLPGLLIVKFTAPERLGRADIYSNLLKPLIDGNWHLINTPLAGLGFQFISISYEKSLFGNWDQILLGEYLQALWKFLLLTTLITPLVASLVTSNVKQFSRRVLLTQFLSLLLLFVIMTHHHSVPTNLLLPTNWGIQLEVFWGAVVGTFIISISLVSGYEWIKGGCKSLVLFLLSASILSSLFFLVSTWMIVGHSFTYEYTIHRYLTIPSIGSSIFLATLVYAWFKQRDQSIRPQLRLLQTAFIASLILYTLMTAKGELDYNFQRWRSIGIDMHAQKEIQDRLIDNYLKTKNSYVYYEQRSMSKKDLFWNGALIYEFYADWVPLRKYYSTPYTPAQDWCVGVPAYNFDDLKKAAVIQEDGSFRFEVLARCGKEAMKYREHPFADTQRWTFTQDEFLAFTLQDGEIIDITDQILKRLSRELELPP